MTPEVESHWLEVRQGAPQGTVLGPLLFNHYVNYLPNFINCHLFQYADDAFVNSFDEKIADCKLHLEKSISSLFDSFSCHSLKMNSEKTEFIVFGTSSAAESIKVDNHIIKEVECEISRSNVGQKFVVTNTQQDGARNQNHFNSSETWYHTQFAHNRTELSCN